MIHTYKSVRDQVLRQLDETATDSPTTLALVKDAVQAAHYQRCTEYPWPFMMWPREESITTVLNQHEYTLHPEFHRPLYFKNTTQKALLQEVPLRMIGGDVYDWDNDTGVSEHFVFWDTSVIKAQPASASVLYLTSSSASDSGAELAVRGEDSSGNIRMEVFTCAGTTTVTGTVTFETILSITKAAPWNGTMTLKDAAGVTIHALLACEMGRVYRRIYILEAPSPGGETIKYRFYRQPLPLVNDYDIVELPSPHGQLLVWDALIGMSGYLTETTATSLGLWRANQQAALLALYQAYGTEGQTVDAEPSTVRYIER